MNDNLEPVKIILREFLNEMDTNKTIRSGFSESAAPGDSFGTASYWEKESGYAWLYAEPLHFRKFMHRPKPSPVLEYYLQPALPIYQQWNAEEKEIFNRGEIIPPPSEKTNLADYLQQLALMASEKNEHRAVWIKSLRCFLQFLREDTNLDQRGALEVLFPSKMEFRKGHSIEMDGEEIKHIERRYILRRIRSEVYPIDVLAASEILQNLAKTLLEGRPNSQRSAAEALGFAWLCHAVGAHCLVTRKEELENTLFAAFVEMKD